MQSVKPTGKLHGTNALFLQQLHFKVEEKPIHEKGSKEMSISQNVDNTKKTTLRKPDINETMGNNTDWVFDDIQE